MADQTAPQERLQVLFKRLEDLGLRDAPLKDADLSMPQLAVLMSVGRSPGIGVGELAETLGVTTPTVSVALRKLEKQGWLRREADPEDRRAAHIHLTQKAMGLAQKVRSFHRKRIDEFMDALSASEQDQLVKLLEKSINHLESKNSNTIEIAASGRSRR
jgi:DNA-binding MarR family transcriptional regulator